MAPKRKRSIASSAAAVQETPIPLPPLPSNMAPPPVPPQPQRRASSRSMRNSTNPEVNPEVLDGPNATRASPDGDPERSVAPKIVKREARSESPLSDGPSDPEPPAKQRKGKTVTTKEPAPVTPAKKTAPKAVKKEVGVDDLGDPEGDEDVEVGEDEIKAASMRPPPVNSDYLPLPWKGRLGYACLNTYLRLSHPPVFSSRTCRIASILEHRHPLKDPTQPEHATKNRPDKDQPADIARGQRWVEQLGLANARDIIKMVRWNDKYNIKFMRLSSEMFPFASHDEYGYKLAPFASETMAEVGKVVAELGHRVTTHPGQFTQLGSPRTQVVENAIRDLEYHDELLTLLKLPPQQDRDAVMILHMGGIFEGKPETIARFKENYARLSDSIKRRLVLENDDMCWSVHDLLPVCKELAIPMVLDYHHHNIIFDASQIREGTKDIMQLYPDILALWKNKNITPKMHYSESCPGTITGQQRRKHSPRVASLPPCPDTMDLMIEAKDKEQAVFELMKIFRLPGHERIGDIIPYVRFDDNRLLDKARPKKKAIPKKPKKPKKSAAAADDEEAFEAAAEDIIEDAEPELKPVAEEEVGMGGPEGRVYWPPTMEEWLRPKKREVKKKDPTAEGAGATPAKAKTPKGGKKGVKKEEADDEDGTADESTIDASMEDIKSTPSSKSYPKSKATPPAAATKKTTASSSTATKKRKAAVPTPSTSDGELDDDEDTEMPDLSAGEEDELQISNKQTAPLRRVKSEPQRKSRRAGASRVSYVEDEGSE